MLIPKTPPPIGTPNKGWRRKVYQLYLRDGAKCARCGETNEDLLTVDHIIQQAKGGGDQLFNLQFLCHSCHTIKSKEDNLKNKSINQSIKDFFMNKTAIIEKTIKIIRDNVTVIGTNTAGADMSVAWAFPGASPETARTGNFIMTFAELKSLAETLSGFVREIEK